MDVLIRSIIDSTRPKFSKEELLKFFLSIVQYNKIDIKKKLISAGIYSDIIASLYYFLKMVPFAFLIIIFSYFILIERISLVVFMFYFTLTSFIFLVLPDLYLKIRSKKRIEKINQRIPFLLDLMNICVSTGMTIEASLKYLSSELKIVDKDLAYIIHVTIQRSSVVGIEIALEEFYQMVPTSEVKSFVMTILNNLRFGSSVSDILLSLATDIREINMLSLEEKIGGMGAKISIPMIVFIMIPIVVLIAAPGIMRMFQ
ncbi:MAG: type II secretion system F family protein [Turicibacter sp.]